MARVSGKGKGKEAKQMNNRLAEKPSLRKRLDFSFSREMVVYCSEPKPFSKLFLNENSKKFINDKLDEPTKKIKNAENAENSMHGFFPTANLW